MGRGAGSRDAGRPSRDAGGREMQFSAFREKGAQEAMTRAGAQEAVTRAAPAVTRAAMRCSFCVSGETGAGGRDAGRGARSRDVGRPSRDVGGHEMQFSAFRGKGAQEAMTRAAPAVTRAAVIWAFVGRTAPTAYQQAPCTHCRRILGQVFGVCRQNLSRKAHFGKPHL